MIGKSDPYVVVYVQLLFKVKTKVIENNLNPVWNQTFELIVEDKETQSLILEVLICTPFLSLSLRCYFEKSQYGAGCYFVKSQYGAGYHVFCTEPIGKQSVVLLVLIKERTHIYQTKLSLMSQSLRYRNPFLPCCLVEVNAR